MEPRGFLTPLRVERMDAKTWRLLSTLVWRGKDGRLFEVHEGDTTDFASVPWWTQSLLPRTGTWTIASVAHDKRCALLNKVHEARKGGVDGRPDAEVFLFFKWRIDHHYEWQPPVGWFNSVDTDAIFRADARDGGTDPIRAELLWLGVRLGAAANPARWEGWASTAPRVLADLVAITAVLWGLVWLLRAVL